MAAVSSALAEIIARHKDVIEANLALKPDVYPSWMTREMSESERNWLASHSLSDLCLPTKDSDQGWEKLAYNIALGVVRGIATHLILDGISKLIAKETSITEEKLLPGMDEPFPEELQREIDEIAAEDVASIEDHLEHYSDQLSFELAEAAITSKYASHDIPLGSKALLSAEQKIAFNTLKDEIKGGVKEYLHCETESRIKKDLKSRVRKAQRVTTREAVSVAKREGARLPKSEIRQLRRLSKLNELHKARQNIRAMKGLTSIGLEYSVALVSLSHEGKRGGELFIDAGAEAAKSMAVDAVKERFVRNLGAIVSRYAPNAGRMILKFGMNILFITTTLLESSTLGSDDCILSHESSSTIAPK